MVGSHIGDRGGGGVAIGVGVGVPVVSSWDNSSRGRGHAGKDSNLEKLEIFKSYQGEIFSEKGENRNQKRKLTKDFMFSLTCYYCESATGEVVTVRPFISPATLATDRAGQCRAALLASRVCPACVSSRQESSAEFQHSARADVAQLSPDRAGEGQTDHVKPGRHLTTPRPVLPIHNGLRGLF